MNDHLLNDPQFKSVEARLAAAVPQLALIDQQQLLYQCAFAAGEKAGEKANRKSLRRWRVAAATLVALLLGAGVPAARDRWMLAEKPQEPSTPTEVKPPRRLAQSEISISARQTAAVDLDAWQLPPSDRASFADELAHFQKTDPHLRSLAVGTFTRAVLQP